MSLVALLLIGSSLSSLFMGSLLIYDQCYLIPELKSQINDLTIINYQLRNVCEEYINRIPKPSEDLNYWNSLMTKGIYELYLNNGYFNKLIYFPKSELNNQASLFIDYINELELTNEESLREIFINKSKYSNFDVRLWNLVQFETNYYFSKIRFLYHDNIMNNLILNRHINVYNTLEDDFNLLKVIKSNKMVVPQSFNFNDQNFFNKNNFYFKI